MQIFSTDQISPTEAEVNYFLSGPQLDLIQAYKAGIPAILFAAGAAGTQTHYLNNAEILQSIVSTQLIDFSVATAAQVLDVATADTQAEAQRLCNAFGLSPDPTTGATRGVGPSVLLPQAATIKFQLSALSNAAAVLDLANGGATFNFIIIQLNGAGDATNQNLQSAVSSTPQNGQIVIEVSATFANYVAATITFNILTQATP